MLIMARCYFLFLFNYSKGARRGRKGSCPVCALGRDGGGQRRPVEGVDIEGAAVDEPTQTEAHGGSGQGPRHDIDGEASSDGRQTRASHQGGAEEATKGQAAQAEQARAPCGLVSGLVNSCCAHGRLVVAGFARNFICYLSANMSENYGINEFFSLFYVFCLDVFRIVRC